MPADNRGRVAAALTMLGAAYRGDWSDFDGRTLRSQLDGLAGALTSLAPFDVDHWAAQQNICPERQAWAEHCEHSQRYTCPHVYAALGLDWPEEADDA